MNSIVEGTEGDLVDSQIVIKKGTKVVTDKVEFIADRDLTIRDLAAIESSAAHIPTAP